MIALATIGGLLAALFWGAGDYLIGKSGQQRDTYSTNLVNQFVVVLALSGVILWYRTPLVIEFNTLVIIIASGIFFAIASLCFIKSLSIGPFGVAAPLSNSYALVTLLIGIFFLGFEASVLKIIALLVVIMGVVMLAVDRSTFDYKKLHGSTIYFATITMVCWGVAFAAVGLVSDKLPWYQLLWLISIVITFIGFLVYLFVHKKLPNWNNLGFRNMKIAWYAGILLALGSTAFFVSVEQAQDVVIPSVIASAAPLGTSFLAYLYDGEKLSLYKRAGAVTIVLGLMLLNLF
ncbi:hypothetical protein A3F55_00620 [Candidatus Adlerbacteria bacterium RIFCSPHIGHO2_12_FULL_53_18]|uniref:EamA domain-containing protein n=1 Tax=Candidatus Adlerbacteria bacterium RIFCSPHIGHO2_12_FULL_53_18 TaxID=1797242 RepID=A0A1F4XUP1_9BACT|nr:MAG: hypothetical protein A3F55_00620 [Candidatus Adlerbacteria bacterium RIFCSPHIGHO2_12_FULL_53_18]